MHELSPADSFKLKIKGFENSHKSAVKVTYKAFAAEHQYQFLRSTKCGLQY